MFKALCPRLTDDNHRVASGQCDFYNCVAWAAHTTIWYIWPDDDKQFAWPPDMPRGENVANLVNFFIRLGFRQCRSMHLVHGVEKIAIYVDSDGPQHVARQLANGKWASKLGELADIEHVDAKDIGGGEFGEVAVVMERTATGTAPRLPALQPVGIVL